VPEVWAGVVGIFRDHGYRRLRNRARLKFLVADWGVERFREVLEGEYLGRSLPDGPAPVRAPGRRPDHVGVHLQKDGLHWVGVTVVSGRIGGERLAKVAELARRHGSGRIRVTVAQNILVLDVPGHEVAPLQAGLAELGLDSDPSEFRRGALACTGIEFCKLALVETKNRTDALITELERRLPDFDTPLSIHVNGCPNACARTQVADIGLKGMVIPDPGTGEYVEGYQVHLGGAIGPEAGLARKTRALKVSATELPDYVERIAGRYLDQRGPGESFAHWARRADEEDLR
jgi:sulfite reductase (ferredoxin)